MTAKTDSYDIYTVEGIKIHNSQSVLYKLWGNLTESVLDRLPSDMFGRIDKIYIDNILHWIVRESQKSNLKEAKDWSNYRLSETIIYLGHHEWRGK